MVARLLRQFTGAEKPTCPPPMLEAICKACAGIISHITDQPAKYMAVGQGLIPALILMADSAAESAAKARLALRNLAHGEARWGTKFERERERERERAEGRSERE